MPNQPSGHPEGLENVFDSAPSVRKGQRDIPGWLREGSSTTNPTLHDAIRMMARSNPVATAIENSGTEISYGDLDHWSDQLAGHLQSLGIGVESMVAICFDQSLDALIAMLGVLKAGAAYLPLDPYLTESLWRARLEASDCQMLITNAEILPDLPEVEIRQLCLDAAWPIIDQTASFDVKLAVHNENLACATFFCGTHPLANGVHMPHRALYNLTSASCMAHDLKPCDRVLQLSPLETVFAAAEIFPAWLSGATLVTVSDWFSCLDDILKMVEEQRITVVHLPTDAWFDLVRRLEHGALDLPRHLRLVVVGEEAASPRQLKLWQSRFGDRITLQTTYGTNGTRQLLPTDDDGAANLDDGRPDVRSYLLNPDLKPVSVGEVGELFIAGSGLGRGYGQRPADTAQHFLPDPLTPSGRMYRTGHLARRQADGTVEFLGHQSRTLMGFRVDLGEGHAVYREPTAIEAVFLTPDERPAGNIRAEKELLKRLRQTTGGCVQSSMTGYQTLSAEDLLRQFTEEQFTRNGPGQKVH